MTSLEIVEARLRSITENSYDGIILYDLNWKIRSWNHSASRIYGYREGEVLGKPASILIPADRKDEAENAEERIQRGKTIKKDETVGLRKDGTPICISLTLSPVKNSEGEVIESVSIVKKVNRGGDSEEKLRKALKEKDILLRETHHRIQNNMTLISSLLSLQSRQIKDKEALNLLRDSQSRVQSMALLHRQLYTGNLNLLNVGEYLRDLISELFRTYNVHEGVKLEMDIEDVELDSDVSIPLGLIINELISNSLKYAFPSQKGILKVEFHRESGGYVLIIADNGVGLPEDFELENAASLGLQIVKSLTEQINGKIQMSGDNGTCFRISFRENVH